MKVKGTNRHDFDPLLVLECLKADKLTEEDSKRILDNACVVILGLRKDLGDTLTTMQHYVDTRQFWVTGKVAK